jgi:hypothetical protein
MYPRAWYNRVQSVYGGLWGRLHVGPAPHRRFGLTLRGKGGYNSGLRRPSPWTYGGAVTVRRYGPWGTSVQVGFAREVRPQYGLGHRYETAVTSDVSLPLLQNGLLMVTGTPDYYDYVGSRGLQAVVTQRAPVGHARLHLRYLDQAQFTVPSVTSYDLLGRRTGLTPNPLVDPGRLRAVGTQLTLSADTAAYSDHPRRTITLDVEHSTARLGSDFDYTRFRVSLGAEWPTFFRHRFAPNVLRLRAEAGTTLGTVSLQRLGVVSASAPQPRLHTISRPYRGERHLSFFWAHNFRTVPFEWLGLTGLADRNYEVTLFGGHAGTGLHSARPPAARRRLAGATTDGLHHEIGLAVDGLQGLFRLTAAKRLDGRAFSVGVGLSSLSSLRP